MASGDLPIRTNRQTHNNKGILYIIWHDWGEAEHAGIILNYTV